MEASNETNNSEDCDYDSVCCSSSLHACFKCSAVLVHVYKGNYFKPASYNLGSYQKLWENQQSSAKFDYVYYSI